MNTVISIILLCCEVAVIAVSVALSIHFRKIFSKKALWYFLPVFAIVYAVYMTGYIYSDEIWSVSVVFKLIATSLSAFVFGIDLDYISDLAVANSVYNAAAVVAFVLAGVTLVISAIALFGRKMINAHHVRKAIKNGKEFVIGFDDAAREYAKINKAIVIAKLKDDEFDYCYAINIPVINRNFDSDNVAHLSKYFKRHLKNGENHFIVFKSFKMGYLTLIDNFFEATKTFNVADNGDARKARATFTLHLEAPFDEIDVINRKIIDKRTSFTHRVKCFNKYELGAEKFVADYPISKYLPRDFYGEYDTIKPDKKINVVMLGFGKVNYELMKLLVIDNQFVGIEGDKFVNHQVDYYIYDTEEMNIMNDIRVRLVNDYNNMRCPSASKPERPCNLVEFDCENVKSPQFIDRLRELICRDDSFTYVIVSLDSDFGNVSYAEQLKDMFGTENAKYFARVKDNGTYEAADDDDVVCFGMTRDILKRDMIVNDELIRFMYDIHSSYIGSSSNSITKFNKLPTVKRYSNCYKALSIHFKVGLMDYAFIRKGDKTDAVEAAQYEDADEDKFYAALNEDVDESLGYDKYFKLNRSNMLAFSEHSRWIAQYILMGYHQMDFSKIGIDEKGDIINQNNDTREHACITDFYGLNDYHKYALEYYHKNGYKDKPMSEVETYRYDSMDYKESIDGLKKEGYSFVVRKRNNVV